MRFCVGRCRLVMLERVGGSHGRDEIRRDHFLNWWLNNGSNIVIAFPRESRRPISPAHPLGDDRPLRHYRKTSLPRSVATGERPRVDPSVLQVERHTGARNLVGSGAVRDDGSLCAGYLPRGDLVGHNADATGDLSVVALVL